MKHLLIAFVSLMLVSAVAYAEPQPPTNGGNGGGQSGQCTGPSSDRPTSCQSPLILSPVWDAVDAASKRQATVYVCHLPDSTGRYRLIKVALAGWNDGHGKNKADFLAPNGADTDCNAV